MVVRAREPAAAPRRRRADVFPPRGTYAAASIEVHRALGLPLEELSHAELARRYPQVAWDGIEFGLLEREYGILMARRAVQTLVAELVAAGGEYREDDVKAPSEAGPLSALHTTGGAALPAQAFVFACGPWLPRLFPDLLGARIFPTRQEIHFFATPRGDARFRPEQLPAWIDFEVGGMYTAARTSRAAASSSRTTGTDRPSIPTPVTGSRPRPVLPMRVHTSPAVSRP